MTPFARMAWLLLGWVCAWHGSATSQAQEAKMTSDNVQVEAEPGRVELGRVNWGRDLEVARRQSADSGKPVFLLFQEIPGCQTCQNYGLGPMSNPIIVEAIESEFIPVLVYNNRQGKDAQLLKQFNEPSWNNPVVRYLDAAGKDVITRKDRVWTTAETARRMIESLESSQRPVPFYLKSLVEQELQTAVATFAMHCFWEGEAKLGSIHGVVSTRSGWLAGHEVVTVKYQPDQVDYQTLVKTAQSFECASKVFAHDAQQLQVARELVGSRAVPFPAGKKTRDAKASDQKYYLAQSDLIHLPLTEYQATRLNAWIKRQGRQANSDALKEILSPGQMALWARIKQQKKRSPESFRGMSYPVNAKQMATYRDKLIAKLTGTN